MKKGTQWAVLPGLGVLTAAAVVLSAYQGASNPPGRPAGAPPNQNTSSAEEAGARGGWSYSGASTPMGRAPQQPINFPHPVHVKQLGMNCLYCHYAANKGPDPGMPAVGTCMGCHLVVGPDRPASPAGPARRSEDIAKLQQYWRDSLPIPWVRIHKVPDYVQFPHMRHVNAGVTCQACHGDVQNMNVVYQYASLNMGWCVTCHVNGYTPPSAPPAGLEPIAAQVRRLSDSPAPAPEAVPGPAVGMTAYPRRARYDCSTCHY